MKELDTEQSHIVVRKEFRKFQKPSTVIQGLKNDKEQLERLTQELKRKLAAGGTVKEGVIIIQGDHRDRIKQILISLGYSPNNIEVQ